MRPGASDELNRVFPEDLETADSSRLIHQG